MSTIESLVWKTSTIFHASIIPHVGSFLPCSMRVVRSRANLVDSEVISSRVLAEMLTVWRMALLSAVFRAMLAVIPRRITT